MPTKADHNRTHLLMVHSPCLVSPLCTGWRKEDHAASPRRGTALLFLPFFAVFSNRKGSLVGGNDAASRLCAADDLGHRWQPAFEETAKDGQGSYRQSRTDTP